MPITHDVELVAAVLTAGMLPIVPAPANPADVSSRDEKRITRAVGHAVSLYAAVLEVKVFGPVDSLPRISRFV
jgi:hypothetical protein